MLAVVILIIVVSFPIGLAIGLAEDIDSISSCIVLKIHYSMEDFYEYVLNLATIQKRIGMCIVFGAVYIISWVFTMLFISVIPTIKLFEICVHLFIWIKNGK